MREIKFRYIWRRKEDGYLATEIVPLDCWEGRGDRPMFTFDREWNNDAWELVGRGQYTGLKDRNGQEIFIGDLLLLDLISGDRISEVKVCETREIPVVRFFPEEEGPFDGWEPLYTYVGKPDTCLAVVGNNIHYAREIKS